jgi:D-alanine-D-alanine ligase
VTRIERELGYPVFVKPARSGSSIGIAKARDRAALVAAIEDAFQYDFRLIVEEALDAREIEIAGLGAQDPFLSVPAEIIHGGEFYDFQQKYLVDETRFQVPADLPEHVLEEMHRIAKRAWLLLNAYGLSRIDFLVAGDIPYLNEFNTLPGFTSISMYPALLEKSGIEPPELMRRLVSLALERDRHMPRRRDFVSRESWYKEDGS